MSATTRKLIVAALQIAIVAGALWFAGERVAGHWTELRRTAGSVRPSALPLAASIGAVLLLYAVQIHGWRVLVSAWGTRLPFWSAARIWAVSNLARFLPASPLFTTGTMALLAARAGVSPIAATGSALLGTLLNIGTGFVIIALTGAELLRALNSALPPTIAPVLAILGGVGLVAMPLLVAPAARIAGRLLRRPIELPPLPIGVLATAVTANAMSWLLYGAALRWLSLAFFAGSGSGWVPYIAVFTASYLAGFLAIPVPAGLFVRESIMLAALPAAHLMTPAQAAVVAVASRLVLTVLEAVPGTLFLARDAILRSRSSS